MAGHSTPQSPVHYLKVSAYLPGPVFCLGVPVVLVEVGVQLSEASKQHYMPRQAHALSASHTYPLYVLYAVVPVGRVLYPVNPPKFVHLTGECLTWVPLVPHPMSCTLRIYTYLHIQHVFNIHHG